MHHPPTTLSSFIWHFIKPYKFMAIVFVGFAILAGFWGPFNSMLIKNIINILPQISEGGMSLLTWPAALIVVNFIVFDNITWRSIGYINYKFQPLIKNRMVHETLYFMLGSSHQYFQDSLSGRIANQITMLADNMVLIIHRISVDFIRGASLIIVSLIAAYHVNPLFFYTLIIWFLVFASLSILMSQRLVRLADTFAGTESVISGELVDCLTNHSNVRIFAQKDFELARMDRFLGVSKQAFYHKEIFLIWLNIIQGMLIATMMGFSVYFLVYLYGQGAVSIGDFALILGISMELGHMMWYTMARVDDFNQALGKCKQSFLALMTRPDIKDGIPAQNLLAQQGEIVFDQVKFHYKGVKPLFANLSIVIRAGQRVGLVGYSGSGKSTFVSLLLRLYDVTEGRITIDNHDLKDITQDSLHRNIAMIPQDPTLFHRSIMDNIRYGKNNASDEEVYEAAKRAHAHDFIHKLPQGYQSLVGERGVKLSGGQRQRIAIARALLKNAPILILDEATSQLDSVTENLIQESLTTLMKNKTTIVIAHRLSTLLCLDRIVVFDAGSIVEDGTHHELLQKGGLYKTLWDAQIGGFLPDTKTV